MDIYALIFEFPSKTKAGHAYNAVRNLIYLHDCELSTYRYLAGGSTWCVAVVGTKPSIVLEEPIIKALKHFGGKVGELPEELVQALYQRHFEQTTAKGLTWNEQSYE